MKSLVNHPGMSLRDDAADSLQRLERDHGVQPITSAYRPVALQQDLIDQWDNPNPPRDAIGRPLNRPPYLYAPRRPASSGLHTKGVAVDTEAPDVFHRFGEAYGFRFLYAYDKVHFEYDPAYDTEPGPIIDYIPEEFNNMLAMITTEKGQYIALDGNVKSFKSPAERDYFLNNNKGVTTIKMQDTTAAKLARG